jgi:hypothetical protein
MAQKNQMLQLKIFIALILKKDFSMIGWLFWAKVVLGKLSYVAKNLGKVQQKLAKFNFGKNMLG